MRSPFHILRGFARGGGVLVLGACLWFGIACAQGASCRATSGAESVALVELFTSEGCSSCPPADRWLSAAFARPSPGSAVALAFHVDYWDRLGWKDRFASAAFTERQYQAMRANRATFVYTPQVLVQGKPTDDWSRRARAEPLAAIVAANGRAARAGISLDATPQPGAVNVTATARVQGVPDRKGALLYIALVQNGLVSEVKAGENAGVRLAHDHVVRSLSSEAVDNDGAASVTIALPVPADGAHASELVAFVQNRETGDVLQALALPLSAPSCMVPSR